MKNYLIFKPEDFRTGVIITGIASNKSLPYAFLFKKGKLIDNKFLGYDMNNISDVQEAISLAKKNLIIGKCKIFYDSRNLVNPVKTILLKELVCS